MPTILRHARLSERERQVLHLMYVDGLSMRDIARSGLLDLTYAQIY